MPRLDSTDGMTAAHGHGGRLGLVIDPIESHDRYIVRLHAGCTQRSESAANLPLRIFDPGSIKRRQYPQLLDRLATISGEIAIGFGPRRLPIPPPRDR